MRLYRFIICLSIGISLHISVATSVWAQYGQSAPKIEIAVVTSTALSPQNSIDGRIVAGHDLAIVAAIDGVVTLGAWREGDVVGKNDLIAEQDTAKIAMALDRLLLQQAETEQLIRQIRTALDFERALLDLAIEQTILQKARRDRLTELAAENVIPKDRLDEALRTYLQSRQAEIQAQKTLAKLESDLVQTQIKSELIAVEIADARADIQSARLIAPASGQLASMTAIDTGYFRQGEMIAQLRSPESYEIEVDVPVALLGFLRQIKTISGSDATGADLTASFRSEIPQENQKTGTRPVRFTIISDLTPAMMADQARVRLNIPVSDQQPVITIPSDAIIPYADGVYVFVVTEDQVFRRNIKIGTTVADRIVVTDGLTAGEQIVTKGNEGLRDGMTVTIVEPIVEPQ